MITRLSSEHRCSTAGRWMPRVLGAALLASATLAGLHVDPEGRIPFSRSVRLLVVAAGALGALWLVRGGAEAGVRVGVGVRGVSLARGGRSVRLGWEDVEGLDYDAPFACRGRWLPALVLVDREGERWRIPAFIGQGPELLTRVVANSGRDELGTWAEARGLLRRMRWSRMLVPTAYAAAAVLLAVALVYVYGR